MVAWGLSSAGGAQSDTSVAGSIAVNVALYTYEATIGTGATITSTGDLTIAASSPMGLQALALAGAFGTGTAVGASVAVDVVTLSVKATVGDDATINVTGAMSLTATSGHRPAGRVRHRHPGAGQHHDHERRGRRGGVLR